jgi:hypothetical protein
MGLNPEITIEVNPEFFTFSHGMQTIKVDTLVTVLNNEKQEIIAIGENRTGSGIITIALFRANQNLPQGIDKLDLLTAFFDYALGKLFENKRVPVLRPLMIFHGVQSLEQILCGYHLSLLKSAALNGGARGIRFD